MTSKRIVRYIFYVEACIKSQQTFDLYRMGSCLPSIHFNGRSTSCKMSWANKWWVLLPLSKKKHIKTVPGWIVLLQGSWYPKKNYLVETTQQQQKTQEIWWHPSSKHDVSLSSLCFTNFLGENLTTPRDPDDGLADQAWWHPNNHTHNDEENLSNGNVHPALTFHWILVVFW